MDRYLERKKSAISNFSKTPNCLVFSPAAAAGDTVAAVAVGAVNLVRISETILTASWNYSSCPCRDPHHQKNFDAA